MLYLYVELANDLVYVGQDYLYKNIYEMIETEQKRLKVSTGFNKLHWVIKKHNRVIKEYIM